VKRVAAGRPVPPTVPVWDLAVRGLHWTLVGAVALSALGTVAWFGMHQPAGYVALAAVLARVAWAGAGGRHARAGRLVRGPRATLRYACAVAARRAPRHLGHNPLGGWMAVALMLCVAGLAFTGWLYTSDAFWGDETVERLHRALAWMLLALVLAHVAGAILTGRRHHENLVASMLTGRKRAPSGDDIA
jgi:cytochrome b